MRIPVTIVRGDGVGPEIMGAVLAILEAAKAPLAYQEVYLGQAAVQQGHPTGISAEALKAITQTGVLLKGPLMTPQGGGFSSVNVALRKLLDLYANVRPARAYGPYVATLHPRMDLVVIRENEEDLYVGQEYRQTPDVLQAAKITSHRACERIIRYAFDYARLHKRKKVTCLSKDNILKKTDGCFHAIFKTLSLAYPEIEAEHLIVDIGMARIVHKPEHFDVIVLSNLYGDILSDITAQLSGSVALGPSVNIGPEVALFEAIHGCAPDIATRDCANPSGLLLAALSMLGYLGQEAVAERIENAWLATLEAGQHTPDIYTPERSQHKVGTHAFAQAVIQRLGQKPHTLKPASRQASLKPLSREPEIPQKSLNLKALDVFMHWESSQARQHLETLKTLQLPHWTLACVQGRGLEVFPSTLVWPQFCDYWLCRFVPQEATAPPQAAIARLLTALAALREGKFVQVQVVYA